MFTTVNQRVAGSSPAGGALKIKQDKLFECIGFKKVFLKPTDPQKNPVIRKAYVKK